jgi:uncharacterized alkaline shock family protein YloU
MSFNKLKTQYGEITIEPDVITRIAGLAAVETIGIIGMAVKNVKEGIVQILKKESLSKGVKLSVTETGITVGLHIIIRYGTNIKAICESLIESVYYNIKEYTSLNVNSINVYVEGIHLDR